MCVCVHVHTHVCGHTQVYVTARMCPSVDGIARASSWAPSQTPAPPTTLSCTPAERVPSPCMNFLSGFFDLRSPSCWQIYIHIFPHQTFHSHTVCSIKVLRLFNQGHSKVSAHRGTCRAHLAAFNVSARVTPSAITTWYFQILLLLNPLHPCLSDKELILKTDLLLKAVLAKSSTQTFRLTMMSIFFL